MSTITFTVNDDTINGLAAEPGDLAALNALFTRYPGIERFDQLDDDTLALYVDFIRTSGPKGANCSDVERFFEVRLTNAAKNTIKEVLYADPTVHGVGRAKTYINNWAVLGRCPREGKRNPWGFSCCHPDDYFVEPDI